MDCLALSRASEKMRVKGEYLNENGFVATGISIK